MGGWLALSYAGALTGFLISTDGWYAEMNKPSWAPPAWVFGPVWTVLYGMMGLAAWVVWREGGWRRRSGALGLFLVQWLLNVLWTPIFFGLRLPGAAFVELGLLWMALAATVVAFGRVRWFAAGLLVPYWIWVSLAAVLNFALWRLNP